VTSGNDATVRVWDVQSGAEMISLASSVLKINLDIFPGTRYPVAYTPNGDTLLAGSYQSVRVWEAVPIGRSRERKQ
jgi:WD40 repeat protein